MRDQHLQDLTDRLKSLVTEVNEVMELLHQHSVEVRIAYKDSEKGASPRIELWRATEHNDYLKENNEKR